MSATPQASQGQDFVEWKTSDMLHNQKSPPQTRPKTSGLDLDVSADEQIEGSEVKTTYHDKTSGATPKKLNASIAASYNDTDLSPASTFATTATGGDSMPGTPVQPRFTKDRHASFSAMSDQTGDSPSKAESQLTLHNRDIGPRTTNHSRFDGGVSLSHSKADSCPDRLASMVQVLDLYDYTASSKSPQSHVTQIREIDFSPTSKSSGAENVEEHPMWNRSANTSTTSAKYTAGISPENAQSIYPPEACVFVANLAKEHNDAELLEKLYELFEAFGECWIIIRREMSDSAIPFAFVQYKTRREAEEALSQGPGKCIFGRPCRVEATRAHRAIYVTRKDGKQPSQDEVYALLKDHKISEIWTPTMTEMETHGLGNGIWVRFEFYGECKEAVKLFRNNPIYHLVYKNFDSRQKGTKSKNHRGAMSTQTYWRPPPPTQQNKRIPGGHPWESPNMSSVPLTTPSTFPANGSWYDPFSSFISNIPLQPLLSYTQATGHSSSATPHTANTGVFPLLQQHAPPTNTLSGSNFAIYGFPNQPNSVYPQSTVSPISPNHNQIGAFLGYPVSPSSSTGNQALPTSFSMFHESNFSGIPLAGSAALYVSTANHGNNVSADAINRPRPAVISDPSGLRQNPVLHPYLNPPAMNVGAAETLRPSTATTARASSPFHNTGLFTGQLPDSCRVLSAESIHPVAQNISGASQRHEHPSPSNKLWL